MTDLDLFLRENMETITYVVFFGGLVVLATLEHVIERGRPTISRFKRWPSNYALTALNIVILGAIPVTNLVAADWAQARGVGLLNNIEVSVTVALVTGILLRSFGAYWVHFAMHKVPLFWRVHRVHHSDKDMDVSTTVRFHPLEFVISTPITLAIVVAAGISPLTIIVFEILDAGLAIFGHANIRFPRGIERLLQLVIVTPGMHRVHHSSWQPETDSNYSATLSIWDRLFMTYRCKSDSELTELSLGLDEYDVRHSTSLFWLLLQPFDALNVGDAASSHRGVESDSVA